MAFLPKKTDIGRTVRLIKPISCMAGTYTVGHEFKIIGQGNRGHDLEDKDGNRIIECGLHRDCYKFVEELEEEDRIKASILGITP